MVPCHVHTRVTRVWRRNRSLWKHVGWRPSGTHHRDPNHTGTERRGAGSPCGRFFSTVDDGSVPEIQAAYARAARRVLVRSEEPPPAIRTKRRNACVALVAIHAKTRLERPRHPSVGRPRPVDQAQGISTPLLEKGPPARKRRHPSKGRRRRKTCPPTTTLKRRTKGVDGRRDPCSQRGVVAASRMQETAPWMDTSEPLCICLAVR
mmetsp:Transcript_4918/g.31458  ORF Transcript_4918/g.31458 Transcript_4918/m.31458 type:complete len:206 (+) Transcript_4918:3428-4045(+)